MRRSAGICHRTRRRFRSGLRAAIANRYLIDQLERRVLLSGNMLVFTVQPTTTNAGAIIDSPTGVQVTVENSSGQPITNNTDSITIALGSNPGGGMLGGTVTKTAENGVATFSDLSITPAANGYALAATDNTNSVVTPGTSAAFNVDAIPLFNSLLSLAPGGTPNGYNPDGTLISDSAGNLYGTMFAGGIFGDGTIYELSGTNHSVLTTLVSFTGNSGAYPGSTPFAGLTMDANGNLFGTTQAGGKSGDGTIFELAADHTTFRSLVSFTGNSGAYPGQMAAASLVFDSGGNLFGTTWTGGSSGDGTIFELAADHTTFTSLVSFNTSTGILPVFASVVIDSSGNLFGTTQGGGASGDGTIYELSANLTTFTTLVSFTGRSGTFAGLAPDAGLTFDGAGNLYGTTDEGGSSNRGTIFELSADRAIFKTLIMFTGSTGSYRGGLPHAALTLDASGNIYGTTTYPPSTNTSSGTVFELAADHTTFTLLTSTSNPGLEPQSGLFLDGGGNLYGACSQGGTFGTGSIYELSGLNHSAFSTLFSLSGGNGTSPRGNLVRDSNGNLYGTTNSGGLAGQGTIFELSGPNYSAFTTLMSFSSTGEYPNQNPNGDLVVDSSGNLYGTTRLGGASSDGSIFELAADHKTFTNLVSFTGSGNYLGEAPGGGLTLDSSGNLYGTTENGGTNGDGTIFELAANHASFTTLISFTGTSGSDAGYFPVGDLTIDSDGNLYGTTEAGGASNDGTLFELAANHTTFSSLVAFTGTSGSDPGQSPYSAPILVSNGNLYGTTYAGGASNDGSVYELASNHTTFTALVSFTGTSGNYLGQSPEASLTFDSSGDLFGTTAVGGLTNNGTLFELSPNHTTFTSVVSFAGNYGGDPGSGPLAALSLDPSGNLYGTTSSGGTSNAGTVFELASAGVSTLTQASGAITVAPTLGVGASSEYFTSVSVGAGAAISLTPAASAHTVLLTSSVSISGSSGAWAGKLDLANIALDISAGSLSTVANQIQQAYNNGTWTGQGITSTTAATDSTHLAALGVIQNNQSGSALFTAANPFDGTAPGAADVLVKYTYYGDANLSGEVDGSDYSLIDNGYLNHLTSWFNGDFNYDNVINGSDYTLIDNAFNRQGASLAAEIVPAAQAATIIQRAAQFSDVQLGDVQNILDDEKRRMAEQIFALATADVLGRSGR